MRIPTTKVKFKKANGEVASRSMPVLVRYTNSPLAITGAGMLGDVTITHLPTGKALLDSHHDQGELTQLLDALVQLPWPDTEEELATMADLGRDARRLIESWQSEFCQL